MASLEDVKFADILTKDTVFGFIRQVQSILPDDNVYYTIPTLVTHWILLYFFIKESFDPEAHSKKLELSKDNFIVTVKETGDNYEAITAYLRNVIKSGTHQWTFKIIHCEATYTIVIGIWDNKHGLDSEHAIYSIDSCEKSYGWCVSGGWLSRNEEYEDYGPDKCQTGDIVDMIVDLDKLELKYRLNGKDYGVANQIGKGEYKAVISLYFKQDALELMSYQKLK